MHYLAGSGRVRECRSRCIRICCDMVAAMPWPMLAMTRADCRHGSGTRISNTRCDIASWRRIVLRISGGLDDGETQGRLAYSRAGLRIMNRVTVEDMRRHVEALATEHEI